MISFAANPCAALAVAFAIGAIVFGLLALVP
jgi:hypothetical protein